MKAIAWEVFLNGHYIDTVWFDNDMDRDQVKDSLINHDKYDPNIEVYTE